MPKKLKLDLKGLKVNSFVTSIGDKDSKNIMGGTVVTGKITCSFALPCFSQNPNELTCLTCDTEVCCGYSETTCEVCADTDIAAGCNP